MKRIEERATFLTARRIADTAVYGSQDAFSEDVKFVVGQATDWGPEKVVRVRDAFDDAVVGFLDALARRILADTNARQFPDIIAFAFWCRKASLEKLRPGVRAGRATLGRGVGFHVSPSNVPIMAAYNLAMGLIAGNDTIVRVPYRVFPQIEYLCSAIGATLSQDGHAALRATMALIRYDRSRADITRYLSARCDVRVIWGGDATVDEIRRAPLRPHAHELTFPDRYSIAVIDGGAWLAAENKAAQVHGFYNDTYLNDQASCASPRMVVWLGQHAREARSDFWPRLEALVGERYRPFPAQTVAKLEYAYGMLAQHPGLQLVSSDPRVMRVFSVTPRPELLEWHPNGGVFVECEARGLGALVPVLDRRCQTVSYFGLPAEELVALIRTAGTLGGDRIVPIGQTLDFSAIWDGHDILRALSRTIDVFEGPVPRRPS
ncbi:acyl-CoA reductase [Mesorhizobium sp. CO1-1-8]|uniref:acyl-CoA reductase n=1 Tax=Mesorhizobium sp. CO1-1-8 TaxID=2876631 RepID=UPI001CD0CDED|nr:acyl-CoA reductase [Mesorhizobium sp. CO1-1-8]MBZ9770990.1 hypothetical protein [Mesorhizobium sp. CO1-1-8]